MNQHSFEVLELEKIISRLEYYASTIPGKEIITNLKPVSDYNYIKERLQEVTQAKDMIDNFGTPPFGGIKDLRDILKKVNKEMVLSAEEIVEVQNSLAGFKKLKKYFQYIMEKEDPGIIEKRYDILVNKGMKIKLLSDMEQEIDKCIDEYGNIKDSASPKLQSIRDSIQSTENKIREKLQNIIRGTRYQSMLQDSLITKRENRYVVPVKHEYRNTFNGIVHDRSASGMTIFMEPMAIVKLNNKLREIKNEEEAEIYRILQQLSYRIAEVGTVIKENLKISSILDVDFARGEYSCEINGTAPELNHTGKIDIKRGRHPLLQDEPVPIDVEVGGNFSSLVITGPNTGGKTVTLKTIGLFVLMTELGLHIPVDFGSDIYLFKKVFADIGDEQSIEQNLSTFSSHMNKIRNFLNKADDESLVLLDELGAGTDPKEGAALGISLLEKLKSKNAVTAATTHYSQLKSFAYSTEGVQNASVEFDIETLQPTYKLIMGVPGGSNAFDIALKLGIPEEIISRARELIDSQELEVEDIIKDLNHQRKKYRDLKRENQKKNREIKNLKSEYEEKLNSLQNKKSKIIKNAEIEAEKIIKNAKKQSKEIIQKLKDKDFVSKPEIDRTGSEINQKLKEMEEDFAYNQEEIEYSDGEKVEKGDLVRVRSVGQKGKVLDIDKDNKEAVVQAGIMKVTAGLDDLVKVNMPDNSKDKLIKKYQVTKSESVSNSLDLRGERYTEAQRKLDKYIDDAVLAGYREVEIIHGKGSGALREAVAEILEENSHISDFRLGRQKEGGTGVTIAKINN